MTQRRFRPEIEGLRTVAALLIAVFHIYFARVSGGVDVFFVIAGFLVIGSLLGRRTATGGIDVAGYVGRLLRRLLPLALTVLLTVTVAAWALFPPSRQASTFGEVIAAALYVENWALADKAVDYLARDGAVSPVQHFWAMSVQGQLYAVALLAALLAVAVVRWLRRGQVSTVLPWLLGVLAAGSFGWSVWLTATDHTLAYFHTGTRIWEFALGGLLALGLTRIPPLPGPLAVTCGWAGLLLILSCGVVLSVSTSFPGWIALWPVTGAILIIVAGDTATRWSADRLLSVRPLVALGGISYGIYLWHWPILIFVRHGTGWQQVPWWAGIGIIVAAIVLSWVTTRLIERPIRQARAVPAWRPAWAGVAAIAVTVSAVTAVQTVTSTPGEATAHGQAGDDQHPGALALAPGAGPVPEAEIVPSVREVLASTPAYLDACHQLNREPEMLTCDFGDVAGDRTIQLVGGSHAAHWLPALDQIATEHGWRLVLTTKSSCLFTTDLSTTDLAQRGGVYLSSCEQWNAEVIAELQRHPPDLVVTTATYGVGPAERVPRGYLQRWRQLEQAGVPVLAIRDTPRGDVHRPECLEAYGRDSSRCEVPRGEALAEPSPITTLDQAPPTVHFVDLSDYFCDDASCPAVIGNVLAYVDAHHISDAYARTLAPVLEPEVVAALHG